MTETEQFRNLPLRFRLSVFWGFLWRALVTTIGSTLGGGVAGGIIGFVAGALGVPPTNKSLFVILGGVAGAVVGLYFVWLYVHWLFRATFAGHRLQLVKL